jgi:hypothetical protein
MGTRPAPQKPEWLAPGAEVVVKTTGGYGMNTQVTQTTVKTVSTHFFTVEGMPNRFRVATQDHHETGHGSRYSHVFRLDTDEARRWLDASRRAKLIAAAREACYVCSRDGVKDLGNRLTAIAALQAIKD